MILIFGLLLFLLLFVGQGYGSVFSSDYPLFCISYFDKVILFFLILLIYSCWSVVSRYSVNVCRIGLERRGDRRKLTLN